MAVISRITHLFWLEKDEDRGSFQEDETTFDQLDTKKCMEVPHSLGATAMSKTEVKGKTRTQKNKKQHFKI